MSEWMSLTEEERQRRVCEYWRCRAEEAASLPPEPEEDRQRRHLAAELAMGQLRSERRMP
jgi:hypothetical protein